MNHRTQIPNILTFIQDVWNMVHGLIEKVKWNITEIVGILNRFLWFGANIFSSDIFKTLFGKCVCWRYVNQPMFPWLGCCIANCPPLCLSGFDHKNSATWYGNIAVPQTWDAWEASEPHLTNRLGAHKPNLANIYIGCTWKGAIHSGHNFAHATTAQLSWHVQNWDLIGSLFFKLEHHEVLWDSGYELIDSL